MAYLAVFFKNFAGILGIYATSINIIGFIPDKICGGLELEFQG
jgi:hypothetical protein